MVSGVFEDPSEQPLRAAGGGGELAETLDVLRHIVSLTRDRLLTVPRKGHDPGQWSAGFERLFHPPQDQVAVKPERRAQREHGREERWLGNRRFEREQATEGMANQRRARPIDIEPALDQWL